MADIFDFDPEDDDLEFEPGDQPSILTPAEQRELREMQFEIFRLELLDDLADLDIETEFYE